MKYLLIITLLVCQLSIAVAHDVELRFSENHIEGDLLFVDIDIRASTYDFNLADHNLRAYYDHSAMELVSISSVLPEDKYSSIHLEESYTDGSLSGEPHLSYEDDMAFINMSVRMTDNQKGGTMISDKWTTIHRATFKIVNGDEKLSIAWAIEEVTQDYATAFVEVAEWIAPGKIETKNVFDLVNFEKQVEKLTSDNDVYEVKMGPNPTSDYVIITQNDNNANLSIIDLSGATVKEMGLKQGENLVNINDLLAGSYVFLVYSNNKSSAEHIIVSE